MSFGVIEALASRGPTDARADPASTRHERPADGVAQGRGLRTLHALMRDGQVQKCFLVTRQRQVGARQEAHRHAAAHGYAHRRRAHGESSQHGQRTVSIFEPVQFFGKKASLVEVELEIGRTDQIRVRAAHAGSPLARDEEYGEKKLTRRRRMGAQRMFLHAHQLSFTSPTRRRIQRGAPLPPDLAAVIDSLGEKKR